MKLVHFILFILCLFMLQGSWAGNTKKHEAQAVFRRGLEKYEARDYRGALAEFQKAAGLDAQFIQAHHAAAMVQFMHLRAYDQAIAAFTRVIDLHATSRPEFQDVRLAYHNRGICFFLREDFKKALADLSQSVKLKPDSVFAQIWRYLALRRSGAPDDGELGLWIRYRQQTDWPAAVAWMLSGRIEPKQCLAQAIDRNVGKTKRNLCEAHFYIAEQYLVKGNTREAEAHFRECLETGQKQTMEYRIAREELEKLK